MTRHITRRTLLNASVLLIGLLGAGGVAAQPDGPAPGAERQARDYTFVFIRTGPATDLTPEQRQEAFAGHFSNMQRMADEGDLLVAGPFGEPLAAPDHRGLFVIDRADLAEGMVIAGTDPTTKLGVFVLEGHVFTTDRPLRELPRLEKEAEAKRLADPDVPDEWSGRLFVLVTGAYTDQRLAELNETEGVLIAGRLHASGPDADADGNPDDEVLAWLDATDVDGARALLGINDADGGASPWTWHGWYGSATIEHMAE